MTTNQVLLLKINKLCIMFCDMLAIVVGKLLYFDVNNECGKADFWQKNRWSFFSFFQQKVVFWRRNIPKTAYYSPQKGK